jgi:hypothetical protein
MQAVLPYRPESYPPKGRIWPQFGDEVLEHTLSLGEGIRHSLQKKKEGMSQWHQENLAYHGLAPKPDPADMPVPDDDPGYPPDAPRPPSDPLPYNDASLGASLQPPPDPPQGPNRRYPQNKLPRARGQTEPEFSSPGLPPGPPDSGRRPKESYYMGDRPDPRVELQGGLGKPPDAPGGGVGLRGREYFRTTQPGAGGLPDVQFVVGGGGGPPPQPPGAGALLVPVNQDDVPMALQASNQGPPRPPGGGGMAPRLRDGPYGKAQKVSFAPDTFPWGPQPESMDSSVSNPAPITPMQEQNTVPKRPREQEEDGAGNKKKPAALTAQSPPSLPPPPPGGAGILRPTQQPAADDNDDAQTVAYGDEDDDNQTVAYGEEDPPQVSAAAAPPQGDNAGPEHVPTLPISSGDADDPDDDWPSWALSDMKTKKLDDEPEDIFPLTRMHPMHPSSSSSSRRLINGPKLANQRLW